jgi:predicted glycosyltransferase
MKRLLVYSHDTYGLGNIRRMLAICQHLLEVIPDLSILLVTGSPVIHSLRLPALLDYIKLPCLTRTGRGEYSTKYLSASINEAIQLRADLILAAVKNFKPDLLMVDKKPLGVKGELSATLDYLQATRQATKLVLILRDILDNPEIIISNWERNGHYEAIKRFYDAVLVLGERAIFDPITEYRFPPSVAAKVEFCGYIRKEATPNSRAEVRAQLKIDAQQKLALVTPGGGEDGYHVIATYLTGLQEAPFNEQLKSLVICGPEMPATERAQLQQKAAANPQVILWEFAGDMLSLMEAADVIVAMGGYNTVCEILSLQKPALVIPRVRPTEEQWLRAARLGRLGYFKTLHPDELTPHGLMRSLAECLESDHTRAPLPAINLNALPVVAARVATLLEPTAKPV